MDTSNLPGLAHECGLGDAMGRFFACYKAKGGGTPSCGARRVGMCTRTHAHKHTRANCAWFTPPSAHSHDRGCTLPHTRAHALPHTHFRTHTRTHTHTHTSNTRTLARGEAHRLPVAHRRSGTPVRSRAIRVSFPELVPRPAHGPSVPLSPCRAIRVSTGQYPGWRTGPQFPTRERARAPVHAHSHTGKTHKAFIYTRTAAAGSRGPDRQPTA